MLVVVGCASEAEREELPLEDDFSGDCSWSEENDEDVSLGCEDDQYRVLFKSTERPRHIITRRIGDPIDSGAVEADVTLNALPGAGADDFALSGLGCVASPPDDPTRAYAFSVLSTGSEEHAFAIIKVDETDESLRQDRFQEILVLEPSDAVAGVGAKSHIRGECRATGQGVELAMSLDGKQVGTASDPNGFHPFDGFAFLVAASKAGTDIRYDNFRGDEVGTRDSE